MIYNQGFGGGMKPKIIVTAPTGTVVTATKGTTVITAGESGGKYVILADDYGVWTIAGTKGSQSVSQDVNVVAVDTYEVALDFTPKVLNDATWEQIRDVADASTGPNYWSVGDTKQITMNGKVSDGLTLSSYSTWVYIIGFDHNKDVEGTGIAFGGFKSAQTNGVDLALIEPGVYGVSQTSGQWFNMNNNNSSKGGWSGCNMRNNTLPVVKSAMPTELTSVIKTTSIYTDNTGGAVFAASHVTATKDDLYLLAEFEIFGTRSYANTAEQNYQQQYAYYAAGNSKVRYNYGSTSDAVNWWERSVAGSQSFGMISYNGTLNMYNASWAYGLAPAFKVGSNPPPQPISALAVGSSVFCNVNGVKTEFVVVNQGKPSDMYDDSCNGSWLLMKDVYESKRWHTSGGNLYSSSYIYSYLNNTFISNFDDGIQGIIKQVKIPYVNGYGSSPGTYPVASGANGLSSKIFLLSCYEVGWTSATDNTYPPADGALLSYFGTHGRLAYKDGSAAGYWLRSPYVGNTYVYVVNGVGNCIPVVVSRSATYGIRPAFILPFDTQVDFHGNIVI